MKKYLIIFLAVLMVSLSLNFINGDLIQAENIQSNLQTLSPLVSGGDSVLVNSEKDSQEKKDCYGKGCFNDNTCYPYGYVKEGKFCADDYVVRDKNGHVKYTAKSLFVEQVEIGKNCINNFECLTNLCIEEICINRSDEISRQVDARFEELKQEIINKAEEELNKSNESVEIYLDIEEEKVSVDKNIIERILNWIKNIF